MHSVLDTVDAAFVKASVYDPAVVFASAILEILRLVQMLLERIGWDGPLIVSCSLPAIVLLLDAIELVLGLILGQNVYSRRRYVLLVRACLSIRA